MCIRGIRGWAERTLIFMWGVTRDVCRGTFLRRDGIGGIDACVKVVLLVVLA